MKFPQAQTSPMNLLLKKLTNLLQNLTSVDTEEVVDHPVTPDLDPDLEAERGLEGADPVLKVDQVVIAGLTQRASPRLKKKKGNMASSSSLISIL